MKLDPSLGLLVQRDNVMVSTLSAVLELVKAKSERSILMSRAHSRGAAR